MHVDRDDGRPVTRETHHDDERPLGCETRHDQTRRKRFRTTLRRYLNYRNLLFKVINRKSLTPGIYPNHGRNLNETPHTVPGLPRCTESDLVDRTKVVFDSD